jgi:hypothetical protein
VKEEFRRFITAILGEPNIWILGQMNI